MTIAQADQPTIAPQHKPPKPFDETTQSTQELRIAAFGLRQPTNTATTLKDLTEQDQEHGALSTMTQVTTLKKQPLSANTNAFKRRLESVIKKLNTTS